MKKLWSLLLAIGLILAACSDNPNNSMNVDTVEKNQPVSTNSFGELQMQLEALEAYKATFTLVFEGESSWKYTLVTRADGETIQYNQVITGVSGAQNPGDFRLVHTPGVNQMTGEGTDNLCMQFPDSFDAGIEFLSPVDLVNTASFNAEPGTSADTEMVGRPAISYFFSEKNIEDWDVAEITFWLDEETEAVLRYDLDLEGNDPLFGAGLGTLKGSFIVEAIAAQEIQPIGKCAIRFPITDDAREIFQLPGLVAYETDMSVTDLGEYYHEALLAKGWKRRTLPQSGTAGEWVMSYVNAKLALEINVEPLADGARVELYYGDR